MASDDDKHPRDERGRFTSGLSAWAEKNAPELKPAAASAGALGVRTATPKEFRGAFAKAFEGSPYANHVTHYSEEELRGMTLLVSADGKSGVAVHDHGDGRVEATALFNSGGAKGGGPRAARARGHAGGGELRRVLRPGAARALRAARLQGVQPVQVRPLPGGEGLGLRQVRRTPLFYDEPRLCGEGRHQGSMSSSKKMPRKDRRKVERAVAEVLADPAAVKREALARAKREHPGMTDAQLEADWGQASALMGLDE